MRFLDGFRINTVAKEFVNDRPTRITAKSPQVETSKEAESMAYRKINVELIVFEEETDSVIRELNSALDRLEETHTIFGGGFEICPVEHSGARRKSALQRTQDAGTSATSAVKLAAQKVADAYKKVV